MGFLPWEIWVVSPEESQLQQSHATKPTVHAGCFSVSIIHRTLTWTIGSLTRAQMSMHAYAHRGVRTHVTRAQMLMHAYAHRGVRTHVRESALKAESRRTIPCCTRELNLRQQRDGLML